VVRGWISNLAETVLLFGAFFFLIPYVPSHEMTALPYQPAVAFAWVLFAASRALRWRRRWPMLVFEVPAFILFTHGLNAVANLLLAS
jgi:hypothetical protein